MRLCEHQCKDVFSRYGIPIPRGEVVETPAAAGEAASRLGLPVAVKAQVPIGGRGKAGGIRIATSPAEAKEYAASILASRIRGLPVGSLLIEQAMEIERELYLGLTVDQARSRVVLLGSPQGGIDIEQVAQNSPSQIARLAVDPFLGLREYHTRYLASFLGLARTLWPSLAAIAQALYRAAQDNDAVLTEINPLALTATGELLALDAKINLDDSALFRHANLESLRTMSEETSTEAEARRAGLSYVSLEGNIGCMVNGAGLAMATLDAIRAAGGSPANFLDVGGGARAERVATALGIILKEQRVRAVLLSIFGGITRCDEVARGVVQALGRLKPEVPIVARLVGTEEAEGRAILAAEGGIQTAETLVEATRLAVVAAGR